MKNSDFLERWGLSSLKFDAGFLEREFSPNDAGRLAAWGLYTEISTRDVARLDGGESTERSIIESTFSIFPITRDVIKKSGRDAQDVAVIAISFLNQVLRPFTAKWHKRYLNSAFTEESVKAEFLSDLEPVVEQISRYLGALAEIARVDHEEFSTKEISFNVTPERIPPRGDFDVFLCHNNQDKPRIREIGSQLIDQGVRLYWFSDNVIFAV